MSERRELSSLRPSNRAMNPSPQFSVPRTGHHNEKFELARTFCWKHKRHKLMRVSIGAPWKRSSMLAQLGHYVNRRNVQAAVSQVWPIFFGGRRLSCRCPGSRNFPKTLCCRYSGISSGLRIENFEPLPVAAAANAAKLGFME